MPYEQLVKGYELSPDRYVVVRPEELESVEPKKTRTIDIEDFVELDQIDPIYYDHPYYLAPAEGAAKAYALLMQAMKESGKVGIARVVIRSKEQLVAIRPREDLLVMETLLFGDEVVPPADARRAAGAVDELKAGKREVEMAQQLIDSLSTDFDPDSYRDEYREAVLELIERKAEGQEVAIQAAPEAPSRGARPDGRARGEHRLGQAPGRRLGDGEGESEAEAEEARPRPPGTGRAASAPPAPRAPSGAKKSKRTAAKK